MDQEPNKQARVRVHFSGWAWDQLQPGDVEITVDLFKPVTATVAEAVESVVRNQLENGAGREVRIEPTSWNGGQFNGYVIVASPDGGYERTNYWAELAAVAPAKHADAEA